MKNDKIYDKSLISLRDLKLPQGLKQLNELQCERICREIRGILVNTVSKTGGHLASNLGVVELTLAIHRVFESPKDKIIWDVGHQAYTHKLLTGRYAEFSTLRQENGISGFPKPNESEHDAFISGHSSTSISVACAVAESMKLKKNNENYAVAVIGDGAFTGGMAYEGLNNAGKSNCNLIIILNHNDMSISKNVGALAKYLATIRGKQSYLKTKAAVDRTLTNTPVVGTPIKQALKISKSAFKSVVYKSTMFEELGFVYLGPVDGHNITELEETLRTAKTYKRPVIIHVFTKKGKGYLPAEKNPGEFHGISQFDIATGNPEVSCDDCYSAAFGKELVSIARNDDSICAVTAAMKYGTGLQYFAAEHRERFFDVGIAEQHAVTFAAGLASMGNIPVFAVYSTFLQRAYDQLLHDTAISNLHIVLGIDRAGVVGEDGETHQGIFDVPFLTSIPNTAIYSPSCYEELRLCLNDAVYKETGIACVRYPRGGDSSAFDKTDLNTNYTLIDKTESVTLLITYGRIYDSLNSAVNIMSKNGISCSVLKLTKIFPVEDEIISQILNYKNIFFFEEGGCNGGISEHFAAKLLDYGFTGRYYRTAIEGFVCQSTVKNALKKLNLDTETIINKVCEKLGCENFGSEAGFSTNGTGNDKKQAAGKGNY